MIRLPLNGVFPLGLAAMLALAAAPSAAQAQGPACEGPKGQLSINVRVTGVRNAKGLMAVTLYADDSSKFLVKHGSMYVGRVSATAPVTTMCLNVPKPGVYALAVYHDENASRKLDRSGIIGLPTEGFGFSNNPPTLFSLPTFNSVRIAIRQNGLTATVNLKYP